MPGNLIIDAGLEDFRHSSIYANRAPVFRIAPHSVLGEGGDDPELPGGQVLAPVDRNVDYVLEWTS